MGVPINPIKKMDFGSFEYERAMFVHEILPLSSSTPSPRVILTSKPDGAGLVVSIGVTEDQLEEFPVGDGVICRYLKDNESGVDHLVSVNSMSGVITRDKLDKAFGTDASMGVVPGDEDAAVFPDGSHMAVCTNCARHVVEALGEGQVMGFMVDDNPVCNQNIIDAGGHDFAVILNRYIVDPWLAVFVGDGPVVYDMRTDMDLINETYGDVSLWKALNQDHEPGMG